MKGLKRLLGNRRGAALAEYALLVAGVSIVSAAALSVFGHKVSDLVALSATVIPGAHTDDNAPLTSGKLIETAQVGPANGGGTQSIGLDIATITANSDGTISRMEANYGFNDAGANDGTVIGELIVEAP
jgi:pilus assembly protein Flp/PilA